MTRIIEILISFAIVAVLMLIVGVFLPSHRHLSESTETNRKPTIVFDTINSFARFKDWNAIVLRDPQVKLTRSGPESGVGAKINYDSQDENLGSGSWEITESKPGESVKMKLLTPSKGDNKVVQFLMKPTGNRGRNIEITQTYDVDYGWNLIGRYAGLYVKRHVGDDMKIGLTRLSALLSGVPNVDYATEGTTLRGMKVEELPTQDFLVVNAGGVERSNDKVVASMKSNMEWIRRTMAANGLSAVGPMRIVTTELGRETYTFQIAQQVRKGGAVPSAEAKDPQAKDDNAKDKEAPATKEQAFQVPVAAEGDKLEVKIPDGAPVEYVRREPRRVATALYTGYMAELDNIRNALRAWAMTRGYEVTDRPYEDYQNGIDKAFTAEGQYQVYWNLK